MLLIVVPSQRKVRIEVGRGLEHLLTDATSRLIIENRILPAFRRGDFPAGIKAGVTDIRDVLLGDAEGVKARAKGARRPVSSPPVDWVGVAFFAFIVGSFLYQWFQAYRRARPLPAGQRRRRGLRRSAWGRDPGPTWGGSSGGWSGGGGGWSSGGGSGGGFSGGGGGFGGGGASGDW